MSDGSSALDIMPRNNSAQTSLTCTATDSGVSEAIQCLQSQESSPLFDCAENYADVAKGAAEVGDDEGFQMVSNKKKVRKQKGKLIVGNSSSTNQLQGVSRKSVFCVNRLKPETSVEMVTEYLASQNVSVSSCYIVQSVDRQLSTEDNDNSDRKLKFVTMRLCVLQHDAAKVLAPNLWPVGVTVRPWIFKSGQQQSNRS